jgi:hypothetical protein
MTDPAAAVKEHFFLQLQQYICTLVTYRRRLLAVQNRLITCRSRPLAVTEQFNHLQEQTLGS